MEPRDELIKIQKRIVKRLKEEIRYYVREDTPLLEKYRQEYEREVDRYSRIATQRELVDAVLASDIVYCGDYHTLAQAQRTPIKILEQVIKHRNVLLCVEMVMAAHQKHLDDFLKGVISEEEFLERIDYVHTWGFIWDRYKALLDFAKKNDIPVVGINSEPKGIEDRLLNRDRKAAEIIVEQTKKHPQTLLFILDGDWHVASPHLPRQVDILLEKEGLTRKTLTIFQNSEKIYWQLAKKRLEHRVDIVQITKSKYCVINTTPTVKLRSYLNWIEEIDELGYATLWKGEMSSVAIEDEMLMIINTITDFLELPKEDIDEFSVYSSADLDFLEALIKERHFTPPEIQAIKRQIESDESYYIKKGHIIYLSNLSINHAAEEATHFIDHILTGEYAKPKNRREALYQQAFAEMLGFLGSKIVNQRRRCYTESDFKYFLKKYSKKRKLDPELRTLRTVARYVLAHRKYERRVFKTGRKTPYPTKMFNEEHDIIYAVVHSLGYLLGNSLYYGLINNKIDKLFVRSLFFENFKKQNPSDVYLQVSTLLQERGVYQITEDTTNIFAEDVDIDA